MQGYPTLDTWRLLDIPPTECTDVLYDDVDTVESPPQSYVMGRHDCMWAGTCSNEKHKKPETEPPVVAVTMTVAPIKSGRSVLRTSRNRTRSMSPRPETPSESEEEEESVSVCDNVDFSTVVSLSEVTGQISRTSGEVQCVPSSPSPPAFHTDHSYHSKTTVPLDSLGVQTPSDSEEEIDVVSVVDREKLTTLPNNPSAKDKQELQQTVASAIEHQRSQSRTRKRRAPSSDDDRRPVKRRRYNKSGDGGDKRTLHNKLERMRRVDLRVAICILRKVTPSVASNERAPKVLVLKEATKYIHHLIKKDKKLTHQKAKARKLQLKNIAILKQLRREHAVYSGRVLPDHRPAASETSRMRQVRSSETHREDRRRGRKL